MTVHECPFETLSRLVAQQATGEFICVAETVEVHVFLQRGKVAWATDSEHPLAFTRQLQKAAQIDTESFRDILESCKRERRPLGETLVGWGVATREEVRAALLFQVRLAVDVLRASGSAQTVFLDRTRQFSQYATDLTFDIDELSLLQAPQRRSRASQEPSVPAPSGPHRFPERLVAMAEGLVWAELVHGALVSSAAPSKGRGPRVSREVAEASVLDGALLLVLRTPDDTLAGVSLDRGAALWCRIAAEAPLGGPVSALASFGASFGSTAALDEGGRPLWRIGDAACAATPILREFVERVPEALVAFTSTREGELLGCGVGRPRLPMEVASDLIRRRSRLLTAKDVFAGDQGEASARREVGFCFRSLMTVEQGSLCFATELAGKPAGVLWLFLDRGASQGLGWAYLASLSRQLLHAGGGRT